MPNDHRGTNMSVKAYRRVFRPQASAGRRRRGAFPAAVVLAAGFAVVPMLTTPANAATPTGIVSVNTAGAMGNGASGSGDYWPIAAGQSSVAFTSVATNLDAAFSVPGNINLIYSRSFIDNTTHLVSLTSAGLVPNAGILRFRLSASGRFLAFSTSATNMGLGHDSGGFNLYVRDLMSGAVTWAGTEQYFAIDDTGVITSGSPAVSAQGTSYLTDTGGQLYLVNRSTGASALVSATAIGTPANSQVFTYGAAMSSDARYVAFASVATNLVPNYINACSPNNCGSVFLKDMSTGAITDLGASLTGIRLGQTPAVSANGDYVSFCGEAISGGTPAVYVASRLSGLTRRIDTDTSGVVAVHSFGCPSALSADGSGVFITGENIATGSVNQVFSEPTAAPTGAPAVTTVAINPNPVAVTDSITIQATVTAGAATVVRGEWFIGTDPGVGNGVSMTLNASTLGATVVAGSLAPGIYTVAVRAVDANGAWSPITTSLLVVYDPTGGFATGGGWFVPGSNTSDTGDSLPGLDGTSPANFGFVVKYQNGASTVPGGNLQFHYNVGHFHLKSSAMQWLVVTNKSMAKFQGTATIDGSNATYPFSVQARDGSATGQTNRFVIKIYPAGSDPATASPAYQASGDVVNGAIVIHSS